MKFTYTLTLLLVTLLTVFSSCSKDEDMKPSPAQLLTAHSWKQARVSTDGSVHRNPDSEGIIYKFNADGTMVFTIMDQGGRRQHQAKWELNADASQLSFVHVDMRYVYTIRELKENSLKLTIQEEGRTTEMDLVPAEGVDFMPAG